MTFPKGMKESPPHSLSLPLSLSLSLFILCRVVLALTVAVAVALTTAASFFPARRGLFSWSGVRSIAEPRLVLSKRATSLLLFTARSPTGPNDAG